MKRFISRLTRVAAIPAAMLCLLTTNVNGQTFFQTASDDGIINFSGINSGVTSQFKLSLSTSSLGYQYNYVGGNLAAKSKWLASFSVGAQPDDAGLATFVRSGKLQPGFKINAAVGGRFRLDNNPYQLIDIYLKPQFGFNSYSIYDSTRTGAPVYKAREATYGANALINYAFFPGSLNIYTGAQLGLLSGTNIDDLADGNVQTVTPYPGSATKVLVTDITAVKKGQLARATQMPLSFDLIVDPNLVISKKDTTNNLKIGFFGYYRTDVHLAQPVDRLGFGICFLNRSDPSKIYTSLGFELPMWGPGVTADSQLTNKGLVFATIGYTIK